jgi:hypothetical protein
MANANIRLGYKTAAWFTANPTLVLEQGQTVALEQTGTYKLGDGVTQLSALSFLGGSSYTLTTSEIGSVINGATSATPNDTDLVMSVESSVAKKNTWTQIKAFLNNYFETLFVKKGTITNNTILKGSGTDTATDSSITDDGTTVTIGSNELDAPSFYGDGSSGQIYAGSGFSIKKIISSIANASLISGLKAIINADDKIELRHDIIDLNAATINAPQLTASQRLELDASKNVISVLKGTADNANYGTTAGTVLEGSFFPQRETMTDANKTFSTGKTEVYLTASLTAARTLTLPAASAFTAGTELIFIDEIGGITSTNTVSVTRAGSDTINGLSTAFTLYTPNVVFKLVTDGVSKWTGGVVSSNTDGLYKDWIITYTGFSVNPTSVVSRYMQIGKLCHFWINATAGTSNSTSFTITLPVPASNSGIQTIKLRGTDNTAVTTNCTLRTIAGSSTATLHPTEALGNWVASGSKNAVGQGTYETI